MDKEQVKTLVKELWKESKTSFLVLLYSVIMLFILNKLKLGSNLLSYPTKRMESKVRTLYKPSKEEFSDIELYAKLTMFVFRFDSTRAMRLAFPNYDDYLVDEFQEHRFAVLRKGNKVYVVTRGSNNEQNWRDNAKAKMVDDDKLGKVHAGYAEVSKGVADILSQYCTADDEIYLTGGSMGGATATLIGWYLDDRGYNVKRIVAFANPRVSQEDYGHLPITNIINLHDPVVYLPSFSLLKRYRHQGDRIIFVDGDWYHYKDNWRTDLLTSALFIKDSLFVESHKEYPDRLMELKGKL